MSKMLNPALKLTVLTFAIALLTSCSSLPNSIVPFKGQQLGPKRPVNTVALRLADVGGQKVASISTNRSVKFTEADIAVQIAELRTLGARAGVDAVTNVRVLHDWRRGFVNDVRTPFWALTQGTEDSYFLRGDGVRFNGSVPAGREPQVSDFAGQQLPKGPLTKGKSSPSTNGPLMFPGSGMAMGTAPYVNSLETR